MAAQTDEVAALKRRIEELERAVAEHESGAVVEPHLAANKDLEATCKRLRERNEQLERDLTSPRASELPLRGAARVGICLRA